MGRISIVSPCLKECSHRKPASSAWFSEFRIDHSIEISPYVTGFTRHGISRPSHLGFQILICMCKQTRCGLTNHSTKLLLFYFYLGILLLMVWMVLGTFFGLRPLKEQKKCLTYSNTTSRTSTIIGSSKKTTNVFRH